MKTAFQKWFDELIKMARDEDISYLISPNPEDHRESYEDGSTPEEELDEQKYAASS